MAYIHSGPKLYLTADDQVVEEGDARAATLLVAPGGTLDAALVEKYDLTKRAEAQQNEAEADAPKAKAAPANKARQAAENK